MSTVGILRPDEVIFYHPLDDFTEHTQSQLWTGTGAFVVGKIGSAESAVSADAPSFGSQQTINAAADVGIDFFTQTKMAALDSTRLVVSYGDAGLGKVRVVTVSGATFTMGPEVTVAASLSGFGGTFVSIIALTATTVVFVWHAGGSPATNIQVGIVSGDTITLGATSVFLTSDLDFFPFPVALDATKFVVLGGILGGVGGRDHRGIVGQVSGLSLTFGPVATVHEAPTATPVVGIALDDTRLVIGYPDSGSATVRVITVSGLVMTLGAQFAGPSASGQRPAKGMVKLDSATFVFLYGSPRQAVVVGSVSGTSVTFGAGVEWYVFSNSVAATGEALNSTSIIVVKSLFGTPAARIAAISGLSITFGAETSIGTLGDTIGIGVLDSTKFFVSGHDTTDSQGAVGFVDQASVMTAPTPGAYPATTGNDRLVVALWSKNITPGSSIVTVQRDFTVAVTATTVTLGPASAIWSGAGIATVMSSSPGGMNDGSPHLLVLDFEHAGGGTWTLRTSVDGAAFVSQSTQTSGTRSTAPASLTPGLSVVDGGADQWFDELVMWSGNKAAFELFTTQELANLNDLADTFGEPMNQFEENFGAPLCWQATARMPDGSVWRDSGSGPCPPVVRVPSGAVDIFVTDAGLPVAPRIVEG